jgi:hypothetical protein
VKLVEEPDVLAPTPAAARGAQERRASEPTPPSLRKSLRLTPLGICRSPTLAKRLSIEACLVG